MPETILSQQLYSIAYFAMLFVAPPLLVATVVAFIVGLFQAVTQIQEQTLPQTVKIFVIAFVVAVFGSALGAPLFRVSEEIFTNFHRYGA